MDFFRPTALGFLLSLIPLYAAAGMKTASARAGRAGAIVVPHSFSELQGLSPNAPSLSISPLGIVADIELPALEFSGSRAEAAPRARTTEFPRLLIIQAARPVRAGRIAGAPQGLTGYILGGSDKASTNGKSIRRWLTPPAGPATSDAASKIWAQNSFSALLGEHVDSHPGAAAVNAGDPSGLPRARAEVLSDAPLMKVSPSVARKESAIAVLKTVPVKTWGNGFAVSAGSLLAAWYAMADGDLIHSGFIEAAPPAATLSVAAGIVLAGIIFRKVAGGRSQAITWLFGSYFTSFSVFALGQGLRQVFDRMGLGFFLAALFGGLVSLWASGLPYEPADYAHRKNPIILPVMGVALLAAAGYGWATATLFFQPELFPLLLQDWPAVLGASVLAAALAAASGKLILKFRIGEDEANMRGAASADTSPLGLIGIVLGSIAAALVANSSAAAVLPVWLITLAAYALFESLPTYLWSPLSYRRSLGTLMGFAAGFYLLALAVLFDTPLDLASMIPAFFAGLGFVGESFLRHLRKGRS
ncbi:MAG: hypothetical protein AUJ52_08165 [Elusimicrobia bacterium CG1_02_63_36]|nr:MAG: hypothetical protein AUJ52_08165 [Elusimicrobia bacterium CG1_02_63_36]